MRHVDRVYNRVWARVYNRVNDPGRDRVGGRVRDRVWDRGGTIRRPSLDDRLPGPSWTGRAAIEPRRYTCPLRFSPAMAT